MRREKATFEWDGGTVSGEWHHPETATDEYVVVAHGAGGNMHAPFLVAFADRLAEAGIGALRFNFAYSEAGRRSPDSQARAEACYRAVASRAAERARRLYLGGKSYGGRIASHIVADGAAAAGLVFLGYPLHPPGKPDQLRDEHLHRIAVPMLFFQGTRDAFARADLVEGTIAKLRGAIVVTIDDADHSFATPRRRPVAVAAQLADETASWIGGLRGRRRAR